MSACGGGSARRGDRLRGDRPCRPEVKVHSYAVAGVPFYLLLDGLAPDGARCTLYGAPEKGAYRVLSRVAFGEPIALPVPFDLVIDTAEFPET
ncbi:hypothetical protein [Streptomyces sp. CL7]|uniref:hypothetical protein n=1 Tax=Streptomyces sp. CL7 TaxID=3096006 RepID=UPI002A74DC38|nr:hypothetical protein [Streptomyces sp. CL7]WPP31686.1 hypothetical protein SJH97_21215 [Streptomyces sp. CL7]